MTQPNYKMSFLRQKKKKKKNGRCITLKALRVLAPATGPLILLFSGRDGSFTDGKNLLIPEAIFFWEGGGG